MFTVQVVELKMNVPESEILDTYFQSVLDILRIYPAGISEYELMNKLEDCGHTEFKDGISDGSLEMFQAHFLLFHVLYLIRNRLRSESSEDMEIHCMNIRLIKGIQPDPASLDLSDPLQEYYLNLENLIKTDEAEVKRLLDSFWQKFNERSYLKAAYDTLGVSEQMGLDEIKKQYRTLVMDHHPDKGGNSDYFVQLSNAMDIISRHHTM